MSQRSTPSVIIIGAGLSGLTTAHALKAKGINATIIDGASQIAEPWRARHQQLKLNIYRTFADLPGLPMDRQHGDFVPRDAVLDHLETFARQLDLPIQFETEVQQLSRYGLHSHPDGGGTRLERDGISPALDGGFVAAVKRGQMQMVGETIGFETDSVRLRDGASIRPDIVICATGYRSGLETWFADLDVLDQDGHPYYGAGEADPDHPGLWFTGYKATLTGFFDAAIVAAQRIADGVVLQQPKLDQPSIDHSFKITSPAASNVKTS